MGPMDLAFRLLKRQTELGEFHPDLPSSHGPVTMRRWHPTKDWVEEKSGGPDFDESKVQSVGRALIEGLKAQPMDSEAYLWETNPEGKGRNFKPFDPEGKGLWVYATGKGNPLAIHRRNRKQIGIRKPIDETQGQFRNRGRSYLNEGTEGWIQGDIPPELLVRLPDDYMGGENLATWGARGQ